ncbi:MAG: CBS domain-containing protein [Solirubrobacteraceae bacterium]
MSPATQPDASVRARRLDQIRVSDAMRPGVITCSADTPLRALAGLMAGHRIHCVAVEDVEGEGASRWRILSDLDLVSAAVTGDVEALAAGAVAGTETVTVSDRERLNRAMQRMTEHQVAHLVVVGAASGRPVGVLSTLDIAAVLAAPNAPEAQLP